MDVFIVVPTVFNVPSVVLHQQIMDWAMYEQTQQVASIVIVGGEPIALAQKKGFVQMSEAAAIPLLANSKEAKILHFGYRLKGADKWPQYFIPLYDPNEDTSLGFLKKWKAKQAYKKFVKQATQTIYVHEGAPLSTLPTYDWSMLAATKDQLTEGHPYFLAFLSADELVHVLKEFSIFKKWQQTNMCIVLVMQNQEQLTKAAQVIKSYKFKEAVILVEMANCTLAWMAAAYLSIWSNCLLYHSYMMKWSAFWEVPLLINEQQTRLPLAWHQAGEIFDFSEKMGLSNHFKLYYKDEVYRQSRAQMGIAWLTTINSTFVS